MSFLRRCIPEKLILCYHFCLAWFWALYYGMPARKLFVVVTTGTKGKTTTTMYLHSVLNTGGIKTGMLSSATLDLGTGGMLNTYHMSTPSPRIVQRALRTMIQNGCQAVALEVSSEGIKQFRHVGLYPDVGIFTNLSPEHLASHNNSLETYRKTKGRLFEQLHRVTKKLSVSLPDQYAYICADSEHSIYYEKCMKNNPHTTFGLERGDYKVTNLHQSILNSTFTFCDIHFENALAGSFQVTNALPAILLARDLHIPTVLIQKGVRALDTVPGRMEWINEGQAFRIVVDYAHEALSMDAVLRYARRVVGDTGSLIALVGAEGGGRDPRKRRTIMEACKKYNAYTIITTVDPYEESQESIATDMLKHGKDIGIPEDMMERIDDRREAIRTAFSKADKNAIVVLTAKGAEQSMSIGGKSIPWDDRVVAREVVHTILP